MFEFDIVYVSLKTWLSSELAGHNPAAPPYVKVFVLLYVKTPVDSLNSKSPLKNDIPGK